MQNNLLLLINQISRRTPKVLVLGISIMLLHTCGKDENSSLKQPSTSINKILPLGASRVEGARPEYESFRYELWKKLIDGAWTFDFIGTQSDNASYQSYKGSNFDIDHQGNGGYTSGQILSGLQGWINETGAPDFVLFSSPGGNDALENLPYDNALQNIYTIVDIIQSSNPNATIYLEQMAPGRSDIMTAELTAYFNQLQQDVAAIAVNQTTESSRVIAVDMYSGFTDNFLADDVHYNELGAKFIANKYYEILINTLE